MLSLSYDIWLPVDTENGHTSNVKQANNGQEALVSTQRVWPLWASKLWMQSRAGAKLGCRWGCRITVLGDLGTSHRWSDWSLASRESPVFLAIVGRWTRQKNRPCVQVFPGSIIRKTGQYSAEIKYRDFLFAIILNLLAQICTDLSSHWVQYEIYLHGNVTLGCQ